MPSPIFYQKTAGVIIFCAAILLVGAYGYKSYLLKTDTYVAGSPPAKKLQSITPKTVPYDQIKPPAITYADAFLTGSPSSSYGVLVYADLIEQSSVKTLKSAIDTAQGHDGDVRLILKYLPASTEDGAVSFEAMVLLECSRLTDTDWKIYKAIMEQSGDLARFDLEKLVLSSPDPDNLIAGCRKDNALRAVLREQVQLARGDGIDAAPFVFVGTNVLPAAQATPENVKNAINDNYR